MKIDENDDLHVYAVGLDHVPAGGGTPETLRTHLIEGPIPVSGGRAPAASPPLAS
jgi:hypothetical protein